MTTVPLEGTWRFGCATKWLHVGAARLALVARLGSGGPLSIARLTAGSDVTRQAITKHLRVLADAGLVRGERLGREQIWEIEPARFVDARRYLDHIAEQWDQALGRLKAAVER